MEELTVMLEAQIEAIYWMFKELNVDVDQKAWKNLQNAQDESMRTIFNIIGGFIGKYCVEQIRVYLVVCLCCTVLNWGGKA